MRNGVWIALERRSQGSWIVGFTLEAGNGGVSKLRPPDGTIEVFLQHQRTILKTFF